MVLVVGGPGVEEGEGGHQEEGVPPGTSTHCHAPLPPQHRGAPGQGRGGEVGGARSLSLVPLVEEEVVVLGGMEGRRRKKDL